jgi:hypothetical protein
MIALGRPIAQALMLAGAMVFLYLPLSYYTDRYLYGRFQRRKSRAGKD